MPDDKSKSASLEVTSTKDGGKPSKPSKIYPHDYSMWNLDDLCEYVEEIESSSTGEMADIEEQRNANLEGPCIELQERFNAWEAKTVDEEDEESEDSVGEQMQEIEYLLEQISALDNPPIF